MFKTKDVDLLQKRVRQMINGLATCGLNASLISNSDLKTVLENFSLAASMLIAMAGAVLIGLL